MVLEGNKEKSEFYLWFEDEIKLLNPGLKFG
jgi:hypothetical protein